MTIRLATLSLLILYPIAWFAPLMRAGLLPIFGLSEISVITGLQSLWKSDIFLALIVTVFALFAPYIKTIGLFRNKAKSIHASMTSVVNDFDGEVPSTMDELLTLRGVARKTANVVLGNAFGINVGFTVDTHIQRLAWRLGFVDEPKMDTAKVEKLLMALFPRPRWSELGHALVFHGRYNCTARPNCKHDHPICKNFGVNCDKPYNKSKL